MNIGDKLRVGGKEMEVIDKCPIVFFTQCKVHKLAVDSDGELFVLGKYSTYDDVKDMTRLFINA